MEIFLEKRFPIALRIFKGQSLIKAHSLKIILEKDYKCLFLTKQCSSEDKEMFCQNKRSNFSSLLLAAVCQMFFQPFNKPSLKCHLSGNLSQLFIYRKFVSIVIYPKFPKAIFGTSWSASIILVALIRFIFSPS